MLKLALASALIALGIPRAWAIGPSFDCNAVHRPMTQLICARPDLSRTDLRFVQAYYALRQKVGEAGWQALKQEVVGFQRKVLQQCNVPVAGPLPLDTAGMAACVQQAYEAQRTAWLSQLSGPAAEEANRPVERHVELQKHLQKLGFLPEGAAIDGVYGAGTRAAIVAWQESRHETPIGFLSDADAISLERLAGSNTPQAATVSGTTPTDSPGQPAASVAEAPTPLPAPIAQGTEASKAPKASGEVSGNRQAITLSATDCQSFAANYAADFQFRAHSGVRKDALSNDKDELNLFQRYFHADLVALSKEDLQALIGSIEQCAMSLRSMRGNTDWHYVIGYGERLAGLWERASSDIRMRQAGEKLRAQLSPIDPHDAQVSFQKTHIGQIEGEFHTQSGLPCVPHNRDDRGSPYFDTDTCLNPLAQTGQSQLMDKVAGVPAIVIYMFRNPDKALFHIAGLTDSKNYPAWQRAFVEKWGAPGKTQRIVVKNRFGAEFENAILTWRPSPNVRITLQQFTDSFPTTGAGAEYNMEVSAFQIIHVPTETALIAASTDKL